MGLVELLLVVILIAYVLGAFVVPVGTPLIHLLLVVILVVIVVRWSRGERL